MSQPQPQQPSAGESVPHVLSSAAVSTSASAGASAGGPVLPASSSAGSSALAGGYGLPTVSSASVAAAASPKEWCSRICSLQQERLTPEIRAEMAARQQRSSAAMLCAARAAGVQGSSNRVFNGFSMGVAGLSPAFTPSAAGGSGGSGGGGGGMALPMAPPRQARPPPQHADAASSTSSLFGGLFSGLSLGACSSSSLPPTAPSASGSTPSLAMLAMARATPAARQVLECASAGRPGGGAGHSEAAMRAAFSGVACSEMASSSEAAAEESSSAMARISSALSAGPSYQAVAPMAASAGLEAGELAEGIEGLRVQPASDAELETGFSVFTTYMDKVSEIRTQALQLYSDAAALLPEEGKSALGASVKALDRAENLGIADPPPGEWIVYGMARKAYGNHALISSLVHSLETKLALLQQAVDCPMCLEAVGGAEGKAAHVLACCHKTCQSCWANWSSVCAAQHKQPFCPLCRGPAEFLEVINA